MTDPSEKASLLGVLRALRAVYEMQSKEFGALLNRVVRQDGR